MNAVEREQRIIIGREWLAELDRRHRTARAAGSAPPELSRHEIYQARFLIRWGTEEDRKLATRFLPYTERRKAISALRVTTRNPVPQSVEFIARKMALDIAEKTRQAVLATTLNTLRQAGAKLGDAVGTTITQQFTLADAREKVEPFIRDIAVTVGEMLETFIAENESDGERASLAHQARAEGSAQEQR